MKKSPRPPANPPIIAITARSPCVRAANSPGRGDFGEFVSCAIATIYPPRGSRSCRSTRGQPRRRPSRHSGLSVRPGSPAPEFSSTWRAVEMPANFGGQLGSPAASCGAPSSVARAMPMAVAIAVQSRKSPSFSACSCSLLSFGYARQHISRIHAKYTPYRVSHYLYVTYGVVRHPCPGPTKCSTLQRSTTMLAPGDCACTCTGMVY